MTTLLRRGRTSLADPALDDDKPGAISRTGMAHGHSWRAVVKSSNGLGTHLFNWDYDRKTEIYAALDGIFSNCEINVLGTIVLCTCESVV
jgi:hypothetical protein